MMGSRAHRAEALTGGAHRATRVLLAAGAVGPVLFWLLGGVVALTWPGYDPIADSISSLVNAPLGVLQTFAFLAGAVLAVAWAVGAGRAIGATPRDHVLVRGRFMLQASIVLAFALFPTDPDGMETSLVGLLHLATFFAYAIATPITLIVVGRIFRRDTRWASAATPTVTAGVLMAASTVLAPVILGGPLYPWLGLLERIYVGIPAAWQIAVAVRAIREPALA
jgi:hypothetical protein